MNQPSGETSELPPGRWTAGEIPSNVRVGLNTLITDDLAFKRFHSQKPEALVIGAHCTMDGVHFDLGEQGEMRIGDYCYFTNAVLLCELEVRIGSYVVIGWNTTISDTDFHPLAPAERIADAIACSSNLVLAADPGQCSRSNVTFFVSATDNCGVTNLTSSMVSGSTTRAL